MQKGFYQAIVFAIFISLLLIIYNNLFVNSLVTENTLINTIRGKDLYRFEVDLRSCNDSASETLVVDSTSALLHGLDGNFVTLSANSDYNASVANAADEPLSVSAVSIESCYKGTFSDGNFTVSGLVNGSAVCSRDYNSVGSVGCFSFDCYAQSSFSGSDLTDLVVNIAKGDVNSVDVDRVRVTSTYTANKRELDGLSLVTGVQISNVGDTSIARGNLYHADASTGTISLLGSVASLNSGSTSCVTVGSGSVASGDTLLFTFSGGSFPLYVT